MPKLIDLDIPSAFSSYLEPNEQLRNWAYGFHRTISLLLAMLGCSLVAMILAALVNLPIVRAVGVLGFVTWFVLFMLFFYLLAYFPVAKLAKTYLVALSDKRLMVILIKTPFMTGKPDVNTNLGFIDYALQSLSSTEVSIGKMQSFIKINDAEKPFEAKFAHAMSGNREQVEAISAALKREKWLIHDTPNLL